MEDEQDVQPQKYRCFMKTHAGMYAQYDGHVDVWCDTDNWDDLFTAAVRELRRTAFPDYVPDMWKMLDFSLVDQDRGQRDRSGCHG